MPSLKYWVSIYHNAMPFTAKTYSIQKAKAALSNEPAAIISTDTAPDVPV